MDSVTRKIFEACFAQSERELERRRADLRDVQEIHGLEACCHDAICPQGRLTCREAASIEEDAKQLAQLRALLAGAE